MIYKTRFEQLTCCGSCDRHPLRKSEDRYLLPSLQSFAFTLILSVCTGQSTRRIPTRPVITADRITTGVIFKSTADIPDACRPQTECPTAGGLFTCGVYKGGSCRAFCGRTISAYARRLAGCRRRVSALAGFLLFRSCIAQCAGARRQVARPRAVSVPEQTALRKADCSRTCRAGIAAEAAARSGGFRYAGDDVPCGVPSVRAVAVAGVGVLGGAVQDAEQAVPAYGVCDGGGRELLVLCAVWDAVYVELLGVLDVVARL